MDNEQLAFDNNEELTQNIKLRALSEKEFAQAKHEVRQCWRALGMLQLRMENDMRIKAKKYIDSQEIIDKISDISKKMQCIVDDISKEK